MRTNWIGRAGLRALLIACFAVAMPLAVNAQEASPARTAKAKPTRTTKAKSARTSKAKSTRTSKAKTSSASSANNSKSSDVEKTSAKKVQTFPSDVEDQCSNDYFRHCSSYELGSDALRRCMEAKGNDLAPNCQQALRDAGFVKSGRGRRRDG